MNHKKPFIAVMIVPTGIGAEIGGHAGDANPAARLIASVCDKLIIHPNVVNASDINEMTENMLYVEGSMLDRFLEGYISLKEVNSNKILVVVNPPVKNETINAVSAARATIGADIEIMVLNRELKMTGGVVNGLPVSHIYNAEDLINQVREYEFDALAITTQIDVGKEGTLKYWAQGGINPWGHVEAQLSKLVSRELQKPVAHAPVESDWIRKENYQPDVVDPRMSAEAVSVCYLHCVLKGLHKAPRPSHSLRELRIEDVDCLISPFGCYGRPHRACGMANVPIIVVEENMAGGVNDIPRSIVVQNYMEAVGHIQAMKTGITPESVHRPLRHTVIHNNK